MAKLPIQAYQLKAQEGGFRLSVTSGLLTGVAAATATAGHLFACRWSPPGGSLATVLVPKRISARLKVITGFTATQEVGIDLVVARGYTASHTGGTQVVLTGNNQKLVTAGPTSLVADMRIGNTGALTAGTHTLDANPITQDDARDLAEAATVAPVQLAELVFEDNLDSNANRFLKDEGFVIRNLIAMGAGGTARLTVDIEWYELGRY